MATGQRIPHSPPTTPIEAKHGGISTLSVHAGEHKKKPDVFDSITTPVVLTSTYWFKNTQQVVDFNEDRYQSHEYGRYGNPTVRTLEEKLMVLEAPNRTDVDCLFSASGMSSVVMMLLSILEPGSHLIITNDCYRRTKQFISEFFPQMNVTFAVLDPADLVSLEREVKTKNAKLYFSETPTNPYLRCVDITRIKEICHPHNCLVAIDTTFASPAILRPLEFGADLVLHSGTKYLSGHNDTLSGAITGKTEIIKKIKKMQNIFGPVLDPHAAYLILRGLKTLHLRVLQASKTAMELAKILEGHSSITRVYYPGLPSHPDHHIIKKHFSQGVFGGMLSFEIVGDFHRTALFVDSLKIPYMGPSLGGVESLVEIPACMSFWNLDKEERYKVGIKDNLVRFSCGIEDTRDVISDVLQALEMLDHPSSKDIKIYSSRKSAL